MDDHFEKKYIGSWDNLRKKPIRIDTKDDSQAIFEGGGVFTGLALLRNGMYLGWVKFGKEENSAVDLRLIYFDPNLYIDHVFLFSSAPGSVLLNLIEAHYGDPRRSKVTVYDSIRQDTVMRTTCAIRSEEITNETFRLLERRIIDYTFDFDTLDKLFARMMPYSFDDPPYRFERSSEDSQK